MSPELFKPETPPVAAAAGADDSAWERVLVNLAGQARPLAATVPHIIAAFKGTPAHVLPQPAPGATGPVLTAFDPYKNQSAMRAYAEAQKFAACATPPQSSTAPQAGPAQPAAATGQSTVDGIAEIPGLITMAIGCLNRGVDGHQCAESVAVLNGELAYESLAGQIKSVGVPVAIQLAKAIPEVSGQVAAFEAHLTKFLAEFVEGPQWDDEEAESTGTAV